MRVKNISGLDRFIVDPDGGDDIACPAGDDVEVPTALGQSLLEQSDVWARSKNKPKADDTEKEA